MGNQLEVIPSAAGFHFPLKHQVLVNANIGVQNWLEWWVQRQKHEGAQHSTYT